MSFFDFLPKDAKVYDVFAERMDVFRPFVQMVDSVSRGESQLTRGERELIGAYVSGLNDCRFCVQVHSASATELGMPVDAVTQLLAGLDGAAIDRRLKPLFELARKVTETPHAVVGGDIEKAVAAGWSERAVQDVILVTCIANFMNRFVAAHGISGNEEYYRQAGRRIRDDGFRVTE